MFKASPRQVHLDFHTSPLIHGIGSRFSEENFIKALKVGNLTSITVFAKCHHGMCYYPTKVGIQHPHLDFDLTGAMIDAAHKAGVRAAVYITAGFSSEEAILHPEWCARNADGSIIGSRINQEEHAPDEPRPNCDWTHLCLNDGPYCSHIYATTEEICKRYKELDGLFYDIIFSYEACYCEHCKNGMIEMGLNPECEDDAKKYNIIKHKDFMRKCGEILKKYHPDASIFFNGGAETTSTYPHEFQSHFEMEDLPTSWGGYDKLPLRASYFSEHEKSVIGMTGKFHTNWGEFGGYKTPEALKYEVATMMSYGIGCSVGDQMPPDGEMDIPTYEMIGEAYRYSEILAPYCLDSKQTAKIGIYQSSDLSANDGLSKMLLENQIDFGVVLNDNLTPFETVLFPECGPLSDSLISALQEHIKNGGKAMFIGNSGIKNGKFQMDVGAEYISDARYDCDYLTVTDYECADVPNAKILCYQGSPDIKVTDGIVLATKTNPYFSRTVATYCSHQNTPFNREDANHPTAVQKGNIIYIAHNICSMYAKYGAVYHRRYLIHALKCLSPAFSFKVSLPSLGRVTLRKKANTLVLNLLYGIPAQRGNTCVMEDMPKLYNIPVEIFTDKVIKRVYSPIESEEIQFSQEQNTVRFSVPELHGHRLIVLETE